MNAPAIARRYAQTLLETAEEQGLLPRVAQDVEGLRATLAASPELVVFLSNPLLAGEGHSRALEALFSDKVQPLTRDFLRLVATRRRGGLLPAMLSEFAGLAEERTGTVSARVRSAVPLDQAQADRLRQRLGTFTGRQVRLEIEVDPAVGSGAVVQVGDTIIDGTVATRLERLRRRLVGV
jgi:F-type H+-transporting ATPase subunit delta